MRDAACPISTKGGGGGGRTVVDPHAIVRSAGHGEAAALRERRAEVADVRHVPKAVLRDARFLRGARGSAPPPPPSRTKWTRRVPHPVLIGHAASLTPY